jgi:hypothetical protein
LKKPDAGLVRISMDLGADEVFEGDFGDFGGD